MIDDGEAVALAASDFSVGVSGVFLNAAEDQTDTITGLSELGALTEAQDGIQVVDQNPHFTTESPDAAPYVDGDSITIATVKRTILDVHTDGTVRTFVLDKIASVVVVENQ